MIKLIMTFLIGKKYNLMQRVDLHLLYQKNGFKNLFHFIVNLHRFNTLTGSDIKRPREDGFKSCNNAWIYDKEH